jgi:hypothetical protein
MKTNPKFFKWLVTTTDPEAQSSCLCKSRV